MADVTLTLLNNVLRGLRREEIASGTTELTDEYHLTLLDFLNTAKSEAEEAWDWEELFVTATVTQALSTDVTIPLVSTGASDIDVSNKAAMLYEDERNEYLLRSAKNRKPMIFDITAGNSNNYRLRETSVAYIERMRVTQSAGLTGDPCYFALRDDDDGNKELLIYPEPAAVRTFQLHLIEPTANLTNNAVGTDSLKIPSRPVWLKALWYANQERGDEMGREGSTLDKQQDDALANAIGRQMTDEDHTAYLE